MGCHHKICGRALQTKLDTDYEAWFSEPILQILHLQLENPKQPGDSFLQICGTNKKIKPSATLVRHRNLKGTLTKNEAAKIILFQSQLLAMHLHFFCCSVRSCQN